MDYGDQSLKLHKTHHGKLELKGKIPLKTKDDLSVAYTPGVAAVSAKIAAQPEIAKDYTIKGNSVAIVTDGSAILGLGNLGPLPALPVMEGKAILFKEFAGIDAFPICLSTQDTEEIIKTVTHIAPVFGGINLEDISAPRCFEIERRLKETLDIPVMHDDQHGTAVVVLAGLINALKLRAVEKQQVKIVINGAGAAGIAITKLLLAYGFVNLTVCDSKGIIYRGRKDVDHEKIYIAERTNRDNTQGGLRNALHRADIFIGVSRGNLLTPDMIKIMNAWPIIFALANPVPEIMPQEAYAAGAYIVATGRSDFPNQINNILAFPGIFRGALDNNIVDITETMLMGAAERLAAHVMEPSTNAILPDPLDKNVAATIAKAINNVYN